MVSRLRSAECDLDASRSIPATVVPTPSAVGWECFPEGGGAFLSQSRILSHNRAGAYAERHSAGDGEIAPCHVRYWMPMTYLPSV